MNGFLVLGREQPFDAMLGLFEDRETAIECAGDMTEADIELAVLEQFGPDCELCAKSVGIVEFIDAEPQPFEVVKEFEASPVES